MKKKERDQIKEVLLQEKERILKHLENLSVSSEQQMDIGTGDDADLASIEISQAALQKIGKRESFLLRKIDLALEKCEDGSIGVCEECGEDIAFARLMARPVAQLCIDCKTEQESVEKRFQSDHQDDDMDYISEDSE